MSHQVDHHAVVECAVCPVLEVAVRLERDIRDVHSRKLVRDHVARIVVAGPVRGVGGVLAALPDRAHGNTVVHQDRLAVVGEREHVARVGKRNVVEERSALRQRHRAADGNGGEFLRAEARDVNQDLGVLEHRHVAADRRTRLQFGGGVAPHIERRQRLSRREQHRARAEHAHIARHGRLDSRRDVLVREEATHTDREGVAAERRVRSEADALHGCAALRHRRVRCEHAVLVRAPLRVARAGPAALARPLVLDAPTHTDARKAPHLVRENQKFRNRTPAVAVVAPPVTGNRRRRTIL